MRQSRINDIKDSRRSALLGYCAAHDETKIMKVLIDNGANINNGILGEISPLYTTAKSAIT
jgi:hypothetical protein